MVIPFADRVVVDSADRDAWLTARRPGLGASDVASYANESSYPSYVRSKLSHGSFTGNRHTDRGHRLEGPILASQGMTLNTLMYRAADNPLHFATPDGIAELPGAPGRFRLAQVKTTMHAPGKRVAVPAQHRRQMWWEQYVLGPTVEFTDYLVLRVDDNGIPLTLEPTRVVFDRDDEQIAKLIRIADMVLPALTAALAFERTTTEGQN